jgi:ParB family chromosome partitioning protein
MTEALTIPLNKLAPWSGNVRRTGATDGIDELAASIAAHGLLQSLVVREGKRGKYDVIAGGRRYLALRSLVESGILPKDQPIPCLLATGEVEATELSLAENVVRAPMHPADQFEAFRTLIDQGATVTDVAARFGISEHTVSQRLKLGRLAPAILSAYRDAEIDLECAQAFAVSDDHEAQVRVYGELTSWSRQPQTIRRALTTDEVATTDKRVRFVGVDVYQAAGGHMRQDLFSDDGTGYVQDVALLDRLVAEKLTTIATTISSEGWLWVDSAPQIDHQALARFTRQYPEHVPLPKKQQVELDRLSEEYDTLVDDDDADTERLAAIDARIDRLNAKTEIWPEQTLVMAGALVTLGHDGNVRIERGLVRKADLTKAQTDTAVDDLEAASDATTVKPVALSPRLVEDLTAERTAAIAAELTGNADIALAAVVHALALDLLYPGYGTDSCLKLRITPPGLRNTMARPDASKPLAALDNEKIRIGDHLPGNPTDLWTWCLGRSRDELLCVLAYVAGAAVDAIQRKGDRAHSARLAHADSLAKALNLDMTAWYTPTAEGFFNRIQRAQILAAIDEAKGGHGPALDKLKKSELALRAETTVIGTGWLPTPLRERSTPATDDAIAKPAA